MSRISTRGNLFSCITDEADADKDEADADEDGADEDEDEDDVAT